MADLKSQEEKATRDVVQALSSSLSKEGAVEEGNEHAEQGEVRKGWRGLYRNALVQIIFVSLICFCGPGMFNALNGLGGGGKADATTVDKANVAHYATFATVAFFSGSIINFIGPRLGLFFGSIGYALYAGSLLSSNINGNQPFVIAAGALQGVSAGLLWTAEGSLMLAYATESTKGRYIAIFWGIFNLGAVIGSAVPLGENIHNTTSSSVSNGTYIGLIVLMCIGVVLPLLLAKPSTVVRADGTKVTVQRHPSWTAELKGMALTLWTDPFIITLFPFFLASNWFYTYQFNDYNLAQFNTRTRSLNNFLYWLSQIFGAGLFGLFLDSKMTRRLRAQIGFGLLFVIIMVVWGGCWAIQRGYERGTIVNKMDFTDSLYAGRVIVYILFGITDAMWQAYAYWIMGALSNDHRKLAHMTGFYKSIQSAGAAVIYRLDGLQTPYKVLFGSSWGLTAGGLLVMLPMVLIRVKNHTELADEVIARMDDKDGHIRDVKDVEKEI